MSFEYALIDRKVGGIHMAILKMIISEFCHGFTFNNIGLHCRRLPKINVCSFLGLKTLCIRIYIQLRHIVMPSTWKFVYKHMQMFESINSTSIQLIRTNSFYCMIYQDTFQKFCTCFISHIASNMKI